MKFFRVGLILFFIATRSGLCAQVDPYSVTILRDSFGMPHIFSPTDAGAAYGLGWANAEDAFEIVQEALITARGMRGIWKGKEGAPFDFFVQSIRANELIKKEWPQQFDGGFVKYLNGYCEGINAFAKAYPERVLLKKAFPISPEDVLSAFTVSFAALCGVPGNIEQAVNGSYDPPPSKPIGSNAFAMNANKTTDGKTYLCMNPHFMVEGPLSFYEAHIQSEEGLNVSGALFQGAGSILMGSNEKLGWGMTYNYFDRCDIFKLKTDASHKGKYSFDGTWKKLEKKPLWLKVRVGKKLIVPVRRMTWQSVYGPTFKSPGGEFYAVRAPSIQNCHAAEAYYLLDKSQNITEFKAALGKLAIPMFNVVYADFEGNIFYVENGAMPKRNPDYNWAGLIPGDSSASLWTELYAFDDLPQVQNPSCGFVFNTNNSPFLATCKGENEDAARFPNWMDERPGNNNRAERILELVNQKPKLNYEDFKAIKFDNRFPETSTFLKSIENIWKIDPLKYPSISIELEILKNWDKVADSNSIAAALFEVTLSQIFRKKHFGDEKFVTGVQIEDKEFAESLEQTRLSFIKNFGTAAVPLKTVHRFFRKENSYSAPGFPDLLMASYTEPTDSGIMKINFGDSYTQFAVFGQNGLEKIESVLPFATHLNSEKYQDQLSLYRNLKCKPESLKKEDILLNAAQNYHPVRK